MHATRTIALLLAFTISFSSLLADDIEHDPIHYSKSTPNNIISQFQERLSSGKTTIRYDDDTGYFKGVLQELKIPLSSQVLVFSKTSMQRSRITPKTPRALYFNDDVYVGFCLRGDVLEFSAVDTKLGTAFYTLDQEPDRTNRQEFFRQKDNCLTCHA